MSRTWRAVLVHQRPRTRAADPFTVRPLTFPAPGVLPCITRVRRPRLAVDITGYPAAARVWR